MKIFPSIIIILAACFTMSAALANILLVDEDVKVLAINMEKPDFDKSYSAKGNRIFLKEGINQIVFKYQPEFVGKDLIKTVYGDVIIAKFKASSAEMIFELPTFKSYREAQREISPLDWKLKDTKKGEYIDIVQDTLIENGVQIGRNYVQEARDYNIKGGVAAIPVSYITIGSGTESFLPEQSQSTKSTSQENQSVDLMKMIYLKASPKEQNQFKLWLNNQ
ncbi:hypothetical protein CCZ37_04930 [Vibrio qinghaiensis]|uniref:Uncharacterized protein n=1 Tax=Vibrio qinghaiensis TaxID=2025808 RepID=A0A223MWK7_9VIBR|nr:DUF2057 family protein [Vibrio qinghaiensis]ASU21975.1 hypothetical protein CCZ37_04930 [Vibrio qinghaiensis]